MCVCVPLNECVLHGGEQPSCVNFATKRFHKKRNHFWWILMKAKVLQPHKSVCIVKFIYSIEALEKSAQRCVCLRRDFGDDNMCIRQIGIQILYTKTLTQRVITSARLRKGKQSSYCVSAAATLVCIFAWIEENSVHSRFYEKTHPKETRMAS